MTTSPSDIEAQTFQRHEQHQVFGIVSLLSRDKPLALPVSSRQTLLIA